MTAKTPEPGFAQRECTPASAKLLAIRETSDAGRPVVATEQDGPHAKTYREIAARVRDQLGAKGGASAAPKIVIEA